MRHWTNLAKREISKLTFIVLWVLGVLQSVLLGHDIGTSPSVRWGLGVPLVVALLLAGAMWARFARRVRREAKSVRPAH